MRETYFRNMDEPVQKSLDILLYLGHVSHCLKRVLNQREKSKQIPFYGPSGTFGQLCSYEGL